MRITMSERERLQKQTDKLVSKMVNDNAVSYRYGEKSIGQYTKQKRQIEKYNSAMREFLLKG